MTPDGGADLEAIRERAEARTRRLPSHHAEGAWRQCRQDVRDLLALVDAQAERIASLEAGLRPFAQVARDFHVEPDELRAFVGAATPVIEDFRTAARLLEEGS